MYPSCTIQGVSYNYQWQDLYYWIFCLTNKQGLTTKNAPLHVKVMVWSWLCHCILMHLCKCIILHCNWLWWSYYCMSGSKGVSLVLALVGISIRHIKNTISTPLIMLIQHFIFIYFIYLFSLCAVISVGARYSEKLFITHFTLLSKIVMPYITITPWRQ